MLASLESDYAGVFRCPRTGRALGMNGTTLVPDAEALEHGYPIVGGKPILVDFGRSVLDEEDVLSTAAESAIARPRHAGRLARRVKRLLSPEKEATRRNVADLVARLETLPDAPRVLVIGGGTIGQGMGALYEHPRIKIYAFDIYSTDKVQFIADAHAIPLASGIFDAVVIQAVLEHVVQPAEVVAEIWRVLKPGGLVYAETPFMQHVHEGAFDFTRFTESGHRYLFRRFDLLASGSNGGPGIQLMWSLDYFFRSLFRSVAAGKAAKLAVFWLQYLDRLMPERFAVDAASGCYFLGAKSQTSLSPRDIIAHYRGAQR